MRCPSKTPRPMFVFSDDIPRRPSRVRGSVLPQEYTLSQFVRNLTGKHESWTDSTPACEWMLVECDAHEHVTSLKWSRTLFEDFEFDPPCADIKGELQWEYTPQTLLVFESFLQDLSGPVRLALLPSCLREFDIGGNECSGHLDLTHLPCSLELLNLSYNSFEGDIDLNSLPASLCFLNLSSNALYGSLDFSKISSTVRIQLDRNCFIIPDAVPQNVAVGKQKRN